MVGSCVRFFALAERQKFSIFESRVGILGAPFFRKNWSRRMGVHPQAAELLSEVHLLNIFQRKQVSNALTASGNKVISYF